MELVINATYNDKLGYVLHNAFKTKEEKEYYAHSTDRNMYLSLLQYYNNM